MRRPRGVGNGGKGGGELEATIIESEVGLDGKGGNIGDEVGASVRVSMVFIGSR